MTSDELKLVESVEDTAVRLIDQLDMHPDEAVKLAGVNLLVPVQGRKLSLIQGHTKFGFVTQ